MWMGRILQEEVGHWGEVVTDGQDEDKADRKIQWGCRAGSTEAH